MICEKLQSWKNFLLLALESGFRHLDPQRQWLTVKLTHTGHHQELLNVVFESEASSEAVTNLLYAWATRGYSEEPARALLGICSGHLVGLHNLAPSSSRLRRLVIRSVRLVGYWGFKDVGMGRFIKLSNHLRVGVEDMDYKPDWMQLLLDTIQRPKGARHLSDESWELLVELMISEESLWLGRVTYNPQVVPSLGSPGMGKVGALDRYCLVGMAAGD